MMNLASDWSSTQPMSSGMFESIPAGVHICKVESAKVDNYNGHEALVLALEIAEGTPLDGYARRDYDRRRGSRPDTKWGVTFRQFTRDYKDQSKTNPYFKGLIGAVEESNPGYQFNGDELTLKGKQIGFIFREEEFEKTDGTIGVTVRPAFFRSVKWCKANPNHTVERKTVQVSSRSSTPMSAFTEVSGDDLPF